jgi:hypothetical protein
VTGDDDIVYVHLSEFIAIAARLLDADVAAVRHQADLGLADSAFASGGRLLRRLAMGPLRLGVRV